MRRLILAGLVVWMCSSRVQGGAILREVWTNVSGGTVADLTGDARYPNSPSFTNWVTDLFEAPIDIGENYGQRMRGVLLPPQSGWYTFWIASDDNSQLWLSTNENPAHLVKIIDWTDWSWAREWFKSSIQQSAAVYLEAGRSYYIQALMKEGGGGDNLAVRWQMPNGVVEAPLAAAHVVPPGGPSVPPQLAAQTATNLTVTEGDRVDLWVSVSNLWPVSYRWQRNSTNLPAATASNHILSVVGLAESNVPYRCILSNSLGVTTSAVITLCVMSDTNGPTLSAVYNVGTTTVYVVFNETVGSNGAVATANYRLSGGRTVTSAVFGANTRTVALGVTPLTINSSYTLTVSNVTDRSSASNVIAAGTQWTFTARDFAPQDIGSPALAGTPSYPSSGVDITAAGAGLGGTEDQFFFDYKLQIGDFDVKVRVASLGLSDLWARAGIMARASLDDDSDFAAVMATPSIAGVSFLYRRTGGGNLLLNGDFESGKEPGYEWPRYWGAWGASVAETNRTTHAGGKPAPTAANDGTWMLYTPNEWWNSGYNWRGEGQWFAVTPGDTYRFSAYTLVQSNLPSGQGAYLNIEWYDSGKSYELGTRVSGPRFSTQQGRTRL